MNLMLSRHGIWYYRKVNVLSNGKRREFRRSLGTRSKTEAIKRAQRFSDRPWYTVEVPTVTQPLLEETLSKNQIKTLFNQYIKFKSNEITQRELKSITSIISKYLSFTDDLLKRSKAFEFIDNLACSIASKNKYVMKIGAFINWIKKRVDFEFVNPFDGLRQKDSEDISKKRRAYTSDEVCKLEAAAKTLPDCQKWIIFIGRYTGMRVNEICQLHRDDIRKVNDVWYIRIDTDHPNQSVKTPSSRRVVPIHNQLISMGLIDYVIGQKDRLFPTLRLTKGTYGYDFSQWFFKFRKTLGVPEFHSLRHYVATRFKNEGVPEQFAAAFLGHSNRSITYKRYGKEIELLKLYGLLEYL